MKLLLYKFILFKIKKINSTITKLGIKLPLVNCVVYA